MNYDHLADRLDAIVADLDELLFDQLREAVARKETAAPDQKRLSQARRAIEKASHLLRGRHSDDD